MAKRIELISSNKDLPKEWGAVFICSTYSRRHKYPEGTSKKGDLRHPLNRLKAEWTQPGSIGSTQTLNIRSNGLHVSIRHLGSNGTHHLGGIIGTRFDAECI